MSLKVFRNKFFKELEKSRLKRILACSLLCALIWNFANLISGSLSFNISHDIICLLLGVALEMIIPWGKDDYQKKLIKERNALLTVVEGQNNMLQEQNAMLQKFIKK